MKKILTCLVVVFSFQLVYGNTPPGPTSIKPIESLTLKEDIASFNPPAGWGIADRNKLDLPPLVKIMVVGKSTTNFPPSINLTSAPYQGTLKDYLQIVKARNQQSHNEWKDLGIIRTQAGNSSLSQADSKTQWGDIRQMHIIHLKNGIIYVLTAAALKSEFSLYYQDFFKAMRSFRISSSLLDSISNSNQKVLLQNEIRKVQSQWKIQLSQNLQKNSSVISEEEKEKVFNSEPFFSKSWEPFKEMLKQNFTELGPEWLNLVQQNVKSGLYQK